MALRLGVGVARVFGFIVILLVCSCFDLPFGFFEKCGYVNNQGSAIMERAITGLRFELSKSLQCFPYLIDAKEIGIFHCP
jgi:hypothetical protein